MQKRSFPQPLITSDSVSKVDFWAHKVVGLSAEKPAYICWSWPKSNNVSEFLAVLPTISKSDI